MHSLFDGVYRDRTVLVTGHSGFKGSWLCHWLSSMGARVTGYSLSPPTQPNHFSLLDMDMVSVEGDIRDAATLRDAFNTCEPEIVFHLAAQPLVRYSYEDPVETFSSNVMGTLQVLEACRACPSVKAVVVITSDKAYENKEWVWGYREDDPMGGYDPYSSSKGCCELLVNSYRNSYFNIGDYGDRHNVLVASCRAGNVIGGGDWAADRLIVDMVLAANRDEEVLIRNPSATRPWQHVLEPLSGYLVVGQKLMKGDLSAASGWNFGPGTDSELTVIQLAESVRRHWPGLQIRIDDVTPKVHEAQLLKLDCTKAQSLLQWRGVWDVDVTVERTISWYRNYYGSDQVQTAFDLDQYIRDARAGGLDWALDAMDQVI